MRDYQRDTQQLPLEGHGAYFLLLQHCWTHGRIPRDDVSLAAICKVSVQRWRRQLAPLVAGYFNAAGENKRATAEIEKVEKMRTQRAMAGHNGGAAAQRRKAETRAAAQATVKRQLQQPSSGREAILDKNISSTCSVAARASPAEPKNPDNSTAVAAPTQQGSGLAMAAGGSSGAITASDGLAEVIAKKGWVKP